MKTMKSVLALMLALTLALGTTGTTALAANDSNVGKYYTEFTSLNEVIEAEAELNRQIGAEGFVLLKNNDNNLPFTGVQNISVFGKNSVNPVYSGSGSSGGTSGNTVSIIDSLVNAGFNVNPELVAFYGDDEASGAVRPSMGFASYNYHSYSPLLKRPWTATPMR